MQVQDVNSSISSLSNPSTQDSANFVYDFSYLDPKPVIYQMIRPYDPLVASMNAIENGTAKEFWEKQKQTPSVTGVSRAFDWLLGWGEYYKTASKVYDFEKNSACNRGSIGIVVGEELITGLNATQSDGSCTINDPHKYGVSLYGANGFPLDQDLYCRIQKCIYTFFASCTPHCTPCVQETNCEKQESDGENIESKQFRSSILNVEWYMRLFALDALANNCRKSKIIHVFQMVIFGCEASESSKKVD